MHPIFSMNWKKITIYSSYNLGFHRIFSHFLDALSLSHSFYVALIFAYTSSHNQMSTEWNHYALHCSSPNILIELEQITNCTYSTIAWIDPSTRKILIFSIRKTNNIHQNQQSKSHPEITWKWVAFHMQIRGKCENCWMVRALSSVRVEKHCIDLCVETEHDIILTPFFSRVESGKNENMARGQTIGKFV